MRLNVCDVCSSSLKEYKYIQGEITNSKVSILKCIKCNMLFSNIDFNKINNSGFSHNTLKGYIDSENYVKNRISNLLNFLKLNYLINNVNLKLIDIGCGVGWSLVAANKLGIEAIGIEPMKEASEYGKKVLNVNILNNSFSNELVNDKFDIMIIDQVAEHMLAPYKFIEEATKMIKPGGILFLAIPPNDWLRRLMSISMQLPFSLSSYIKNSKTNYITDKLIKLDLYDMPEGHINIFTKDSIQTLSSSLNLELLYDYHKHKSRVKINSLIGLTSGSYILRKL
jgi:2-polyprenyl-3-methyl-5-hydroxy-6-metoxy-1,4-benzoquinol methylase